jgi:N-acetylneuraminic acid mutarotase
MSSGPSSRLVLAILTLAACGEGGPTQPEGAARITDVRSGVTIPRNSWAPRAALPSVEFREFDVGVVPNAAGEPILYTFGGTDFEGGSGFRTLAYNVITDSWSARDTRVAERNNNGVIRHQGKLWFTGGYSGDQLYTNSTYVYDPVTDQLSEKAGMPKLVAEGVSGLIGNFIYVLPGSCSGFAWPNPFHCEVPQFRRLFRYNISLDRWATKKPAPDVHRLGAGGVINGKFYVVAGHDSLSRASDDLHVYDPATDRWKTLAPIPQGGRAYGVVMLSKLFVVSWGSPDGRPRMFAYDPKTNQWIAKASPSNFGPLARVDIDGQPHILSVSTQGSELYRP